MTVLVDTSIWIEYFNGKSESLDKVDYLLENNYAAINGVILTELLPTIIRKRQTDLSFLLQQIKRVDVAFRWETLVQYQVKNYERGINSVGISDLIILNDTLENDIPILVRDKHFDLMEKGYKFKRF